MTIMARETVMLAPGLQWPGRTQCKENKSFAIRTREISMISPLCAVLACVASYELAPPRQQGAFVYSGSGKKQPENAPPEQKLCTQEACAIQRCLARNNHQQKRCEEAIEAWKRCCRSARESHGLPPLAAHRPKAASV